MTGVQTCALPICFPVTIEMFTKGYMISGQGVASLIPESSHKSLGIQSSQKVGPSIAKDIKNSAYLAIIFAIIGIALYILLRFKNFSFSVGALVSLAYATLFVLGFYSLFSSVMPFSMEIGLDISSTYKGNSTNPNRNNQPLFMSLHPSYHKINP